jgi:hypothetical protein
MGIGRVDGGFLHMGVEEKNVKSYTESTESTEGTEKGAGRITR